MIISTLSRACIGVIVLMALSLQAAGASELVYVPINPSFGGNPNNGPLLMNIATAQNSNHAPTANPLTTFSNNLQNAILSHAQSAIITSIFGANGTPLNATYTAGIYTIHVVTSTAGDVTVTTTDTTTGAVATFTISQNLQ